MDWGPETGRQLGWAGRRPGGCRGRGWAFTASLERPLPVRATPVRSPSPAPAGHEATLRGRGARGRPGPPPHSSLPRPPTKERQIEGGWPGSLAPPPTVGAGGGGSTARGPAPALPLDVGGPESASRSLFLRVSGPPSGGDSGCRSQRRRIQLTFLPRSTPPPAASTPGTAGETGARRERARPRMGGGTGREPAPGAPRGASTLPSGGGRGLLPISEARGARSPPQPPQPPPHPAQGTQLGRRREAGGGGGDLSPPGPAWRTGDLGQVGMETREAAQV